MRLLHLFSAPHDEEEAQSPQGRGTGRAGGSRRPHRAAATEATRAVIESERSPRVGFPTYPGWRPVSKRHAIRSGSPS